MWFLLTGVPPLLAANGSTAMPPATARGKIRAVPRKVRSLLAQVLSPNPAARPSDPLEFYGKLQDCLVRVERQEARSFRLVEPSFPGTSIDMPARQSTLRALAFAALFLALAAIAALAISGYVRHRRVVRAEEPIGVPVGVPGSVVTICARTRPGHCNYLDNSIGCGIWSSVKLSANNQPSGSVQPPAIRACGARNCYLGYASGVECDHRSGVQLHEHGQHSSSAGLHGISASGSVKECCLRYPGHGGYDQCNSLKLYGIRNHCRSGQPAVCTKERRRK